MNARELRQKFLEFFESKGHLRHPSGSLVPYDVTGRLDESLLFNGAGMVQFKPYFRGIATPPSKRLTNVQKCVRTGDIEEIGDLTHLSFFEMLGNFSFGDYFKREAIAYSWEFMTSPEWLGLDPRRLSFTVHEEDEESFECWCSIVREAGFDPALKVFRLDEETNFWPAGSFSKGPPGPCGPNSEMFYWTPNDEPPPSSPEYSVSDWKRDESEAKWLEIWNDVFIQYEWKGRLLDPSHPALGWEKEGMDPLPFQSVDTGMGVERTSTALRGFRSVYQIDVFEPVFDAIQAVLPSAEDPTSGHWATDDTVRARATRIISDHARTSCFCIADGVLPGNTGRGYVLRRLIRRAVLKGQRVLGIQEPFLWRVYEGVAEALGGHYTELRERREVIVETLRSEEELFRRTLVKGQEQLEWQLAQIKLDITDIERAFRLIREEKPDPARLQDFLDKHSLFGGAHILSSGDRELPNWNVEPIRVNLATLTCPFSVAVQAGRDDDTLKRIEAETIESFTVLPGDVAFKLYDTYGFPFEVTQELCEEEGFRVDLEGFEAAMKEAQERSRAAHGMESVYGGVEIRFELLLGSDGSGRSDRSQGPTPTQFVGYDTTEAPAKIVGAMPVRDEVPSDEPHAPFLAVALDQTPFYAESGGQVSDTGVIEGEGFELRVVDLTKQDGVYVHLTEPSIDLEGKSQKEIDALFFDKPVVAKVDAKRRRSIVRNHTATHLLHAALREKLGRHVTQAGSLVAPDHLRFDFTHGKAMTPEELEAVERDVNERALDATDVRIMSDVPIEEAKARGAMALFGEKYGDTVRMVEVPGFSLELCGGCHVRNTAEIGMFKILHESSAASGVRRIEAVTGEKAYEWARELEERAKEAAAKLKANPSDLPSAVEKLQEQLREERRRIERLRSQAASGGGETTFPIGPVELAIQQLEEGDIKEATLAADRLAEGKPNRVAFVTLASDGKVQLVCKAGAEAVGRGAHAGNLVREAAKPVGGGGGGRPDFATAGGKDAGKIGEALEVVKAQLKEQVKG